VYIYSGSNFACVNLCLFALICAVARADSVRADELLPEGKKMFICIVIMAFSHCPTLISLEPLIQ
jgi:hypothetical protein